MKKKKKLDVFSKVFNVQNFSFAEGRGGGEEWRSVIIIFKTELENIGFRCC